VAAMGASCLIDMDRRRFPAGWVGGTTGGSADGRHPRRWPREGGRHAWSTRRRRNGSPGGGAGDDGSTAPLNLAARWSRCRPRPGSNRQAPYGANPALAKARSGSSVGLFEQAGANGADVCRRELEYIGEVIVERAFAPGDFGQRLFEVGRVRTQQWRPHVGG